MVSSCDTAAEHSPPEGDSAGGREREQSGLCRRGGGCW
uniref:Uncharacterized protein n=1 Tax=Arundo donax TaxID=35708 RepID=A0A0A9BHM9_ARUDO